MPFVVCVALSACAPATDTTRVVGGSGLEDWSRVGEAAWRFTDTGVEAGPEDTAAFLVSPQRYTEFRLSVEFRIDDETNSGIFVACSDSQSIDPDSCYEVNIWDNHPVQDFRTGSIVGIAKPLVHVDTLGRWNRCEIELSGASLTASFNGEVTARLAIGRNRSGHIALQYAGKGRLVFRNLRIERVGDADA